MWGAWVFRPGGQKTPAADGEDDSASRLGRFWRLPESDSEVGLKKLAEWAKVRHGPGRAALWCGIVSLDFHKLEAPNMAS